MNALVVSPIAIPLLTAFLCMMAWRSVKLQRTLSMVGALALLACSVLLFVRVLDGGVLTADIGGWRAPFGITMVADTLAALMVLLNGVVAVATVVYSIGAIGQRREKHAYHTLVHCLLASVSGSFLSGDIFNIYVWFEVMLMSSFVLLTLGGGRGQLEGALKYVTLNLLSSSLFLSAIGLLYGLVGSLNLADIAIKLGSAGDEARPVIAAIAVLFMASFGIKAAIFPFFFWLPASYHTPAPVVSALFGGILTKVGVYAMVRVYTLIFAPVFPAAGEVLLWIAAFTMVTGVLGAAAQYEIRRILSFHIVSQIGYMIMGLAIALLVLERMADAPEADRPAMLATAAMALGGVIFFILHNILAKTNLFFVAGVVHRLRGTGELKELGGLYKERPYLSLMFMLSAMALAGIPILTGFWGKLILVVAGVRAGEYWIVGVSLGVGVLTLFSMTKIWAEAFWKARPEDDDPEKSPKPDNTRGIVWMNGVTAGFVVLIIGVSVFAAPIYRVTERSGQELIERSPYIRAVLDEQYLRSLPGGIGERWIEPGAQAASAGEDR